MLLTTIGEAFEINPQVRIPKGTEVPFVTMDQVVPGQRNVSAAENRVFKGGSKFEHGDTLMARITPCLENKKIAQYLPPNHASPSAGSTEFIVIRGKNDVSITPFAYYFVQSPDIHELAISLMTGTSGRQRVDTEAFRMSEIWLPNLTIQEKIVKVLGSLDDKIAVNNKIIKIISELLKKYWRYLCNNSSEWIELGNIITFNPQTSKPSKNAYPFLEMKNLPEHGLNAQNWEIKERRSGTKFMNGDVLLARITPCFENGKIGIVDFLKEGEVGMGSTEYIVMRTKSALPPAAIYCIATSSEFRSYAAQSMTGSSGRQRVQVAPLQKFKVPNLKPTTLKEFNSFSQSLLAISKIHRDENQTLARTRDELLPLLMSGKITVRDAEEASAEVGVDKHEVEE